MKLVKMEKDTKDGKVYADVHPDEVENYTKGDWVKSEKPAKKSEITNDDNR